ncbi:MAG: magnesium transporter [Candidatus Omnitrophica bacterium]|nr:magnesium transporter [Candidatus Omnitrophota bacterium]
MNTTARPTPVDQTFFLSEITDIPVINSGNKIGKLDDFQIIDKDKIAEITHILVSRPFGEPSLLIPWDKVKLFGIKDVEIDIASFEPYIGEPAEGSVLLRDHILDKKVLDVDGREVEVVYDVKMFLSNKKLFVIDVDLSRYGLLRRVGLKWLANFIYKLAEKIRSQTVSWNYVQRLPENISSFKGDLKLKILKERLSEMQPMDLADILEELDPEQRVALFSELETEHASDTLEELDPRYQRDLIGSLKKDKAALLINEMTPGQAADILSILPWWEVDAILKLLDNKNAAKIRGILEMQEERAIHFAVSDFLRFSPDVTAGQVRQEYLQSAKDKDCIIYLYILDPADMLLGVIHLKELLRAQESELLQNFMTSKVISLNTDSTLKSASEMFARYGFRALPITDAFGKMLGVVPYRDVMNLKHLFFE